MRPTKQPVGGLANSLPALQEGVAAQYLSRAPFSFLLRRDESLVENLIVRLANEFQYNGPFGKWVPVQC